MERLPLQEESNLHFLESFRESHCCTTLFTSGPYTLEGFYREQTGGIASGAQQSFPTCLETLFPWTHHSDEQAA